MYISLLCNWDLCQGWEWWWGVEAAIQLVTVANVERETFPHSRLSVQPKKRGLPNNYLCQDPFWGAEERAAVVLWKAAALITARRQGGSLCE